MHRYSQDPPQRVQTNGFPSGLEKSPQPLAYLFMREIFTPLQGGLAPFHGRDEAIFLLEVAGYDVLHCFIQFDALLRGSLHEASLQIGRELDFHGLKIR
jgi:hypothetical protein